MAEPQHIAFQPHPGPQAWLVDCPVRDILCGGARGGGKTYGMIARWLRRQAQYGKHCQGVWFRRSLPEIEGAQKTMLDIFPLVGAVYEVQARTWAFPNGARLKLRYLESDNDAARYQGHEYTDLFFDDAGTWPKPDPIDFLRGTMRSSAGVPCCMVLSANPCGAGHEWIKARYLTPAAPLTPFVHQEKGKPPIERVFIPSTLRDNPSLAPDTEAGAAYLTQLYYSGPEHIIAAWISGDWDATPGDGMLDPTWFANFFYAAPDFATGRMVLSIDPAEEVGTENDETGILGGLEVNHYVNLLHAEAVKLRLDPLEARIEELCKALNPKMVIIEKKSVGGALSQTLKRRPGWRWSVLALDPGPLSKGKRMWNETPWFQTGRILLPAPNIRDKLPTVSNWPEYIREMTRFTGADKPKRPDNMVDASSQLCRYLGGGRDLRKTWVADASAA